MAGSGDLVERVRAIAGKRFTEQTMFGGICFMLNGNMALGASPRGLLVRVGKDGHAAAMKRPGTRPMIQRGRPMEGYLYVDAEGTKRDGDLKGWIDTAIAHVATLPAKKKAKPATVRARKP